jgi:hypothetical protein
LVKLGETYRCLGDLDAARATWTEAVRILAELGVVRPRWRRTPGVPDIVASASGAILG